MTQHTNQHSTPEAVPDKIIQAESDLFNALVHRDDVRCDLKHPIDASTIEVAEVADSKIAYPWNPGIPESTDFFNYLDDATLLNAFEDSEVEAQSSNFFNQLAIVAE